jgi:sensor histidine kinase YesM
MKLQLIFIFFLFPTFFFGQKIGQNTTFFNYTTDHGLPSNTIYDIHEDWNGNLVLGTDNGLSIFDGNYFKNINTSHGLKNPYITKIHISSKDSAIYWSCYGLSIQCLKKNKIHSLKIDNNTYSDIKIFDSILFCQAKHYSLHGKTNPKKYFWNYFYHLSKNVKIPNYINYPVSYFDNQLKNNYPEYVKGINEIGQIKNGYYTIESKTIKIPLINEKIYFAFFNGTEQILISENEIKFYSTKGELIKKWPLSINIINNNIGTAFEIDKKGQLWYTIQDKGLYIATKDFNNNITHLINLSYKDHINCIYADSKNQIWIGTHEQGLIIIPNSNSTSYKILDKESYFTSSMNHTSFGFLFATRFSIYSLKKNTLVPFFTNNSTLLLRQKNYNEAYFLIHNNQSNGKIPFLAGDDIFKHNHKFYTYRKNDIFEYKDKKYIDIVAKDELYGQRFYQILNHNEKLICNTGNQIFEAIIDTQNRISIKKNIIKQNTGFISNILFKNDTLIYSVDNKLFYHHNQKIIKTIHQINDQTLGNINFLKWASNRLWIGTDKGLFIKGENAPDFILNKNNFLSDNVIKFVELIEDNIWIGTAKSLNKIPFSCIEKQTKSPHIYETLYYTNHWYPMKNNTLEINSDQILLKIAPKISNLYSSKNQIIKYRLDNSNWIVIEGTEIILTSLSYGTHNLEIAIKDINSSWNITKTTIIKSYPFYLQWWFILIILTLTGILLYGFSTYRFNKKIIANKKENLMQQKIVELRQSALSAMMNPHFIFNCLNAIQYFVNSNQIEKSTEYLAKFARLVRLFLNQAAEPYISIYDEVDRLTKYTELEKIRFYDFKFEVFYENILDKKNTFIPNMILQPFVENAIIHGISHLKEKNGLITVIFKFNEEFIEIQIKDNGNGDTKTNQKENSHISKALSIIEERIKLFNNPNEEKYCIKTAISNKGYTVTLTLPIINNDLDTNA